MNADTNAKNKPTHDQPFGEIPVDAKLLPIFSRCGWNKSRKLFNISFTYSGSLQ